MVSVEIVQEQRLSFVSCFGSKKIMIGFKLFSIRSFLVEMKSCNLQDYNFFRFNDFKEILKVRSITRSLDHVCCQNKDCLIN